MQYLNYRETTSNVKLVTTSIILLKNDMLSMKEIRAGVNAFTLIEKEIKETNLPLKEDIILRAFRVSTMFSTTCDYS